MKRSTIQSRILLLGLIGILFLTSGFGCKTRGGAGGYKPVELQYWGVFENETSIRRLTIPYTQRHPKISIKYRSFREDEYKQKLLEAWAQGQGPDLFMIPSTRIREFLKFMEPMPETMKAPVQKEQGTLKKEIIDTIETYKGLTPKNVRDQFLDVVGSDVIVNNKIYALPYSVDTLTVFYNKDILKQNNIPLPAKSWEELLEQASIISKVDDQERFVQSAIALGTTNNIPSIVDIISTLMMQTGVTIATQTEVQFQRNTESLTAIQFFLTFAQNGLKNYSWNKDLQNALDVFTAGRLAYFIGYPYHAATIRQVNPKLNFDAQPIFKPANAGLTPTYASYWVTAVAKPVRGSSPEAKTRAELAWQYLLESTKAHNVKAFLSNPEQPRTTALKELVESQKRDLIVGAFAQDLLNAQSWYHGYDFLLAEKYFLDMVTNIEQAYANNISPNSFLNAGADLINQTYKPPAQ